MVALSTAVSVADLLAAAAAAGVVVEVRDGNRLRLTGPRSADPLKLVLGARKAEVLRALAGPGNRFPLTKPPAVSAPEPEAPAEAATALTAEFLTWWCTGADDAPPPV